MKIIIEIEANDLFNFNLLLDSTDFYMDLSSIFDEEAQFPNWYYLLLEYFIYLLLVYLHINTGKTATYKIFIF